MQIEKVSKVFGKFKTVLTKKYELLMILLLGIVGAVIWKIGDSLLSMNIYLLISMTVLFLAIMFILSLLAHKEECKLSQKVLTSQIEIEFEEKKQKSIREANALAIKWMETPECYKGSTSILSIGYGVVVEVKELKKGRTLFIKDNGKIIGKMIF